MAEVDGNRLKKNRVEKGTHRDLIQRIERLVGQPVERLHSVQGGYTPAKRLLITLSDGSTLFAKVGTTELTANGLRKEHLVYESLSAPFMPRYLGWDDDAANPILLLEDLSQAYWPPPWHEPLIESVVRTLPSVWRSSLPNLPRLVDLPGVYDGWQHVAREPEPFLSLQLVSERWLETSLPLLLSIDGKEVVAGDSLLHLDIRSDNLCFQGERMILVDWNLGCIGNPDFDLGAWLPSLEAEGGPSPETILPDSGEIAAVLSGFFASRAGLPSIPDAPRVRHVQLVQLRTALPWAVRALHLPRLDGELA